MAQTPIRDKGEKPRPPLPTLPENPRELIKTVPEVRRKVILVTQPDLLPAPLSPPQPAKVTKAMDKPASEGEEPPPKTPDYVPMEYEVVVRDSDLIHVSPDRGGAAMVTPPPERAFWQAGPRQRQERRSEKEAERVEQRRRDAREHEWDRCRDYTREQEQGERSGRRE